MPSYMDIPKAIEAAKLAIKQRQASLRNMDTIRHDLRNAVERKETSADEAKWILETFPLRERTRKSSTKAAA